MASAEVLTAEGVDVALVNVDRLAAECADIDPTASVSLAPNNDAYGA